MDRAVRSLNALSAALIAIAGGAATFVVPAEVERGWGGLWPTIRIAGGMLLIVGVLLLAVWLVRFAGDILTMVRHMVWRRQPALFSGAPVPPVERSRRREAIRTSATNWFSALANAYKHRRDVLLIDDAQLGINPIRDTLLDMGRRYSMPAQQWMTVLTSLGISAAGAGLLLVAILDPEPTSKLSLMVLSGSLVAATGGLTAVNVLMRVRPPSVKDGPRGFEITW